MVLVLSPNSVSKPWVKEEMGAGVMRSITEKGAYVLPALLAKCSIPLLSDKRYGGDLAPIVIDQACDLLCDKAFPFVGWLPEPVLQRGMELIETLSAQ